MKTIRLHAAAPEKPAVGAPCNGCGVCCALSPCPLSRFLLGHRHGTCPALAWEGARYVCGLVVAPRGLARYLPHRLVLRWIGVGVGCDCDAEVADDVL
jgi:hypothetical protein